MFDLHLFVSRTVLSMIGKEPEHKVRQYALGWLERDVLTQEDLAEVEARYAEIEASAETEAIEE